MKYLPLSFLFINLFLFTSAQKQFEGTIIYNLHSNEGKEKDDAELIITFGKNGIKLKVSDGKSSDQSVLMLNFDSGRVYTMEISNKMYRSRRLFTNEKAELPEDKTIAGYKTKAIDATNRSSLGGTALNGMGKFIIFAADSLYYFVPEKYSQNPELMFVRDNHIVLGARLISSNLRFGYEDEDSSKNDQPLITAEAKEIKWQSFPKEEFNIPPDFVKADPWGMMRDSIALMDSTMMADSLRMMDTMRMMDTITRDTASLKKSVNPVIKQKSKTPSKSKPKATTKTKQSMSKPE